MEKQVLRRLDRDGILERQQSKGKAAMNDDRFIQIMQAVRQHATAAAEGRVGMAEPNLSGEWHDDFTPSILQADVGATDEEWTAIADDACTLWEQQVSKVWTEANRSMIPEADKFAG